MLKEQFIPLAVQQRKIVAELPHELRERQVLELQAMIARERIRTQFIQDKPNEMWGFIWFKGLPFIFRAWKVSAEEETPFLKNGSMDQFKTKWRSHGLYTPQGFRPPLFTNPISEDDIRYMLEGLKIKPAMVRSEALVSLFASALIEREEKYAKIKKFFDTNLAFRMAYSACILKTCDEEEKRLKNADN